MSGSAGAATAETACFEGIVCFFFTKKISKVECDVMSVCWFLFQEKKLGEKKRFLPERVRKHSSDF